jgi:hypothetical protein
MSLFDELAEGGPLQYIVVNRTIQTIAVWDPSTQMLRILTSNGLNIDEMPYHASLELMPTNDPEFWHSLAARIRRGDL